MSFGNNKNTEEDYTDLLKSWQKKEREERENQPIEDLFGNMGVSKKQLKRRGKRTKKQTGVKDNLKKPVFKVRTKEKTLSRQQQERHKLIRQARQKKIIQEIKKKENDIGELLSKLTMNGGGKCNKCNKYTHPGS